MDDLNQVKEERIKARVFFFFGKEFCEVIQHQYILKQGNRFNLNLSNLKDFKGHFAFGMNIVLIIYDY